MDIVNVDINKFSNETRIKNLYAVDGTKINFFKQLAKDDFNLSKNGNYCKTLMNTIYDVTNELPVNTILSKNMSEGALLIQQLNEIPKTSIILGDGHYFTQNVLNKMNNSEIFGIFKVPRNINICKEFLNSLEENRTCFYKGIKIRLVKYKHYKYLYGINFSKTRV